MKINNIRCDIDGLTIKKVREYLLQYSDTDTLDIDIIEDWSGSYIGITVNSAKDKKMNIDKIYKPLSLVIYGDDPAYYEVQEVQELEEKYKGLLKYLIDTTEYFDNEREDISIEELLIKEQTGRTWEELKEQSE